MSRPDFGWGAPSAIAQDVHYGFLDRGVEAAKHHQPQVLLNADGATTVHRSLRHELSRCSSFVFSVAFVTPSAISQLKQDLLDFSGHGLIVTANYLNFNSPAVFEDLLHLRELGINVEVRIHDSPAFHAKGYVFQHTHHVTALVGSSNLTATALTSNHEWNLKVSAGHDSDLASQLSQIRQAERAASQPLTREWIETYAEEYAKNPPQWRKSSTGPAPAPQPAGTDASIPDVKPGSVVPNAMQAEALEKLAASRREGDQRALLISATGTGKTILSALDVRAYRPRRMLFIVHREQILDRTIEEYFRVLGGSRDEFGKLSGTAKQFDRRYIFATMQTLSQLHVLEEFGPDAFDYIIIDEAHRAGASSYQRILEHFQPQYRLGMTATPERTDDFNVFELFDYNVPYEIRLHDALDADMLAPFHYFGVADVTFDDGSTVSDATEIHDLVSNVRIEHLMDAIDKYAPRGRRPRGLIFCSRRDEAHQLAHDLNTRTLWGRRLRTHALTGNDSAEERLRVVERLEAGELDYIVTVDIFNEGVDIPSINQVVMLRQTQSAIIFVQQLGRGLRKADGKDHLTVIDVIGNYANNYMIPMALFGDRSMNRESLRQRLIAAEEDGVIAGLSSVRFDEVSRERVLSAVSTAPVQRQKVLREEIDVLRHRLGRVPQLWDFVEHDTVDPVVLATAKEHYPALLQVALKVPHHLSKLESQSLQLLSTEVLAGKRLHEVEMLQELLEREHLADGQLEHLLHKRQVPATSTQIASALRTLTLEGFHQQALARYGQAPVAREASGGLRLSSDFLESYKRSASFRDAVDDLVKTARHVIATRYDETRLFTVGRQYNRNDVVRAFGWNQTASTTVMGYRADVETGYCPIFMKLQTPDERERMSIDYANELLDPATIQWSTRLNTSLTDHQVSAIVGHRVEPHVFVQREDGDGDRYYYLGRATASEAVPGQAHDKQGALKSVVHMRLALEEALPSGLYDYFNPTVTRGATVS